MKKRRLTKFGKFCAGMVAVCLLLGAFWFIHPLFAQNQQAEVQVSEEPTATPIPTPTPTPIDTVFQAEYDQNKQINPEYIGRMTFESGIIDQNLVQTTDNEKYLNEAWDTRVSNEGAVYLDYRNTINDRNLIFYGHYVYYDASKMFTPLESMLDPANYAANKYIDISFSGTDKRRYVITDIFFFPLDSDTLAYYNTSYDAATFQTYYAAVKQADKYDTGETITLNDHWISLQTCVRNHDELRQIVLAKQISS